MKKSYDIRISKTVLFLCWYQAPYGGNFISSLLALEKRLNILGHKCIYAFPKSAANRFWCKELGKMSKSIEFFDFENNKFVKTYDLCKIIDKYNINIVHTHFDGILVPSIVHVLKPKIQVIYHLHSDFSLGNNMKFSRLLNFIRYKIIGRLVRIISVSESFKNINSEIKFVPNGLAKFRLTNESFSRQYTREKLHINDDDTFILMFAWSPILKGVDVAVNAVRLLQENAENKIKLGVICGREITPCRMKKFVAENTECTGNEDWIIYLEPIENIFEYHIASDIMLSASRSEGFSYALLEALCVGNKCVVSNIKGVQWAKEFFLTFTFETQNIFSCSNALKQAIEMPISLSDRRKIANDVYTKYSIEKWCDEILKVYKL